MQGQKMMAPHWMLAIGGLLIVLGTAEAVISCQFANDFCGFTREPAGRWQVSRSIISFTGPKPVADYDYNTGVALVNSAYDTQGLEARLVSQEISLNTTSTLTFWIAFGGFSGFDNPVKITRGFIDIIDETADGGRVNIWSRTYQEQYPYRNKFSLTIQPRERFRLEFKLWVNRYYSGWFGIQLHPEAHLWTPPATTAVPSTPIPTTTPAPILSCPLPAPVAVNCNKGNLTFSDTNYEHSDVLQVVLNGDNSLKCRHTLHEMHNWILRQPHHVTDQVSPDAISVECSWQTGLTVSDADPELTEATILVYSTGASIGCRSVFLKFLDHLANF